MKKERRRISNNPIPWDRIRTDFESTNVTVTRLARHYGVSRQHLQRQKGRERWEKVPGAKQVAFIADISTKQAEGKIARFEAYLPDPAQPYTDPAKLKNGYKKAGEAAVAGVELISDYMAALQKDYKQKKRLGRVSVRRSGISGMLCRRSSWRLGFSRLSTRLMRDLRQPIRTLAPKINTSLISSRCG